MDTSAISNREDLPPPTHPSLYPASLPFSNDADCIENKFFHLVEEDFCGESQYGSLGDCDFA